MSGQPWAEVTESLWDSGLSHSAGAGVEKLFRPDHPGKRLGLDVARVGIGDVLLQPGVKFVGFTPVPGEDGVEIGRR